ncbi:hypothetical protein K1T71_005419 [Dendrolimus kikuchii]|uniref:Uncharacterized protein n=1 Tax=Dendrolimus kikuchii TaxID=765133 RepID=A0ACC1D4J4_9NEOP|nr:hypothetical protein K1T71_005419 [Dendrolimus kikuchii]
MRCITVLFMYNVFSLISSKSVNYCGSKMCRNTNTHTFCQYAPGPGTECTGYIPAPLSKEEKARIMARLNRRRNEAAYGRLRGLPSAGNMLKLRWVEELAREAQLWADQCRPPAMPEEQDVCRDLYSITVGQCVASVVGEAPGLRVESMIDMWYMQSMIYKGNITSYEPSPTSGGYYGDFGQMMWSRAYMVGCGRSRFMKSSQGRMRSVERLVCNIAPRGPIPGRSLWTPAFPVSACPPRSVADEILKGLCNFPETVRQLQEALDRMEQTMETPTQQTQGKVRRELRDFPPEQYLPEVEHNRMKTSKYYQSPDLEAINKTLERGPMMNMMLKYVPYLKDYESNILNRPSSKSSAVDPQLILFAVFIYIFGIVY